MLVILIALLCCGEYKGGTGVWAAGWGRVSLGEQGAEPDKGFFCRAVQWGIDRGDW